MKQLYYSIIILPFFILHAQPLGKPLELVELPVTTKPQNKVEPKTVSVQITNTFLRNKPSFIGKKLKKLNYADKVTILKEEQGWSQVTTPKYSTKGWVHSSALSYTVIKLQAQNKEVNQLATNSEVIMAGKGFSSSIEKKLLQDNKNLSQTYKLVDRLEKTTISTTSLQKFAKNGNLKLQ